MLGGGRIRFREITVCVCVISLFEHTTLKRPSGFTALPSTASDDRRGVTSQLRSSRIEHIYHFFSANFCLGVSTRRGGVLAGQGMLARQRAR